MKLMLDAESEQIVRRHIESGNYPSPGDVVSEALRLLEAVDEADRDELRRAISVGIEEADRGELIEGKEIFSRIEIIRVLHGSRDIGSLFRRMRR